MKHLTRIAFAAAIAASLPMTSSCDKKEQSASADETVVRPVKIITVGATLGDSFREYPAKVKANQRVKLAFQVTGQIINLPVKAGDRVKAGQVIAELDARDYENALKSDIARYQECKADFERQRKLLERSAVSVSVFESKRMDYEVAEAAMRTAAKALEDTKLKASFDGIVAGTYVDNYQNVKAQDPVLSLQEIDSVELVINVPEKDVARASAGKTLADVNASGALTAVFPTLDGRIFPLKIKEYESEADTSTQTFKFVMLMETPKDVNIMPGMTALVRVSEKLTGISKEGHWIPSGAVAEGSDGKRYVWIIDAAMRAHKRIVESGDLKGDSILIVGGLSGGERIATAGVSLIFEDMLVKELKSIDGHKIVGQVAAQK